MREIKFRVWDGKTMWYRGSLQIDMMPFDLSKHTFFEFEGVESGEIVVGNATREVQLMQFTGLTDKKGKEIYEGDIIKKHFGATVPTFVVAWHTERAMFIQNDGYNEPLYQIPAEYIEVIGNIYEKAGVDPKQQKL
jgi:uncharacterized phage protein (TIGR01671 family)